MSAPECNSEACALPSSTKSPLNNPDSYLPPLSSLKGLKLTKLMSDGSREDVDSESIWKENASLIYLVRRPGCLLCRNKAKEIMCIKKDLTAEGIKLAAVVHEELGVEEFRSQFWPEDPIYLNADRSLFAAINDDRKVRKQGILSSFFSADMWKRVRAAKDAGVEGNLKGEGRILGGILLVGRGESGVRWIRTEKSFGNHASNEEILKAVRSK